MVRSLQDMVDAPHLRRLSLLATGERVTFDPQSDFAVLCPSCHRLIHRLDDAGDFGALQALVRASITDDESA